MVDPRLSPLLVFFLVTGSFFSKSKLSLQKWVILIYWWAREYPVSSAKEEAGCDMKTAIDVYQWLGEVCSALLLRQTITLGGTDIVVRIDESQFAHKPKVRYYSLNLILSDTIL